MSAQRLCASLRFLVPVALARVVDGATCQCPEANGVALTCKSTGDPHFTSFSGTRFDFQGKGVFTLADFSTSCGCSLTVQSFQCPSRVYGGATVNAGLALRIGDTTLTILADESDSVHVVSGEAESSIAGGTTSSSASVGETTVERELQAGKWSWRIHMPGDHSVLVVPVAHGTTEKLLNIWVHMPSGGVSSAGGLCKSPCFGTTVTPYPFCPGAEGDRCLPVLEEAAIFSTSDLSKLETSCARARSNLELSPGWSVRKPAGECIEPFSPSLGCGTAGLQVGYEWPKVRADGSSSVQFRHYSEITTAAECEHRCNWRNHAQGEFMNNNKHGVNAYTFYEAGTRLHDETLVRDNPTCLCFAFGSSADIPSGVLAPKSGASSGNVCLPRCDHLSSERIEKGRNWYLGGAQYRVGAPTTQYGWENCKRHCSTDPAMKPFARFFSWRNSGDAYPGQDQSTVSGTCDCVWSGQGRASGLNYGDRDASPRTMYGTLCTGDDPSPCGAMAEGKWYIGGKPRYGPSGYTASECPRWCADEARSSCSIRNVLVNGGEYRCGFRADLGRCAVFVAEQGGLTMTTPPPVEPPPSSPLPAVCAGREQCFDVDGPCPILSERCVATPGYADPAFPGASASADYTESYDLHGYFRKQPAHTCTIRAPAGLLADFSGGTFSTDGYMQEPFSFGRRLQLSTATLNGDRLRVNGKDYYGGPQSIADSVLPPPEGITTDGTDITWAMGDSKNYYNRAPRTGFLMCFDCAKQCTPYSGPTHYAFDGVCASVRHEISACEPPKEEVFEEACEAGGKSVAEAKRACAGVGGMAQEECVFDWCATGGDDAFVAIAKIAEEVDQREAKNHPPSAPMPPAMPPDLGSLVMDDLTELSAISCSGGDVLQRLTEIAPRCGTDCASEGADATAQSFMDILPDIAEAMSTDCGGGEGSCKASETKLEWAAKALEALPAILQKICDALPPAPPDGAPCDTECEEQAKYRYYCSTTCERA